jgi:hypothetical protein
MCWALADYSRGYTSTLIAECELYNSPTNRDHSLRSEANYLLSHEERRTQTKKQYNVDGALFIPCFPISWQEFLLEHPKRYHQQRGILVVKS